MKKIIYFFALSIILIGCNSSKLKKTSDAQFIGNWELKNRGMFEGIKVKIKKNKDGSFTGKIQELNDNKYVNLFMSKNDLLISEIKRNSNFEFSINEKKIAAPLFSAYNQSTSTNFIATFNGRDTILLGKNGTDGLYVRIK